MPRYIDLEELERRINEYVKMPRYASYEQRETADWCKDECIRQAYCMPTADVVPKSKYDLAVAEREANVKGFTEQIAKVKRDTAREIIEEIIAKSSYCVATQNGEEIYETKQYTISAIKLDELEKKYTEGNK